MRLVYLGTPEIAVAPLVALHAAGHEIVLVVSGGDRRRGRGGRATPSPVKAAALELGLTVTDDPDAVLDCDAELGVVVAFGHILGSHLLEAVPMVNLHFSLLPRWRGAAPVERAILAGDPVTGVALMDVAPGLDTGAVHGTVEVPIGEETTADELRGRLVDAGVALLVDSLERGLGPATPQSEEGVTYAAKLSSADRELRWSEAAVQLHRVVRVGGAWTTFRGERLKVLGATVVPVEDLSSSDLAEQAAGTVLEHAVVVCGVGALRLRRVQAAGRAPVAASDWVNGARPVGDRLGG